MLSYEDALAKLLAAAQPVAETRHLPLTAAAGRRCPSGAGRPPGRACQTEERQLQLRLRRRLR